MIIMLIGGIGSGKSLTAIREIVNNINDGVYPVTNFELKKLGKRWHRLKWSELIQDNYIPDGDKKNKDGTPKMKKVIGVNWDFWNQLRKRKKYFSIFLDEAHNLINSRSSMSNQNKVFSKWIAQIRKICGESPYNNIWLITQHPRKIDINFRDLTQIVVTCEKVETKNKVFIRLNFWDGYDSYESGNRPVKRIVFCGNPYFKFYDSYEIIEFKDNEEYV